MRRLLGGCILGLCLTAFAAVAPASAGDGNFQVVMTGAKEVPGPGDPDAVGRAGIVIDDAANTICLSLRYSDVDGTLTGLHIHAAPFNAAGPVVIPFSVPSTNVTGIHKECLVVADEALLDKIAAQPQNYYINLHSDTYPPGAVRAQLADPVK